MESINNNKPIHVVPLAIKTFDPSTHSWTAEKATPVRPREPTIAYRALLSAQTQTDEQRLIRQTRLQNLEAPVLNNNGRRIRLATFNVLADGFPWFVELAIASHVRFAYLPHVLAQFEASIYGLNEVTRTSLDAICSHFFFRQSGFSCVYFDDVAAADDLRRNTHAYNNASSNRDDSGSSNNNNDNNNRRDENDEENDDADQTRRANSPSSATDASEDEKERMNRPHGCALFIGSEFEIIDAFRMHLDHSCAAVGAILWLPSKIDSDKTQEAASKVLIGVVSLHTSAYAHEKNRAMRRRQLADAKKTMEEMLRKTRQRLELAIDDDGDNTKNEDVFVIMGDLNLHDINEEKALLDIGMLDVFAETHYAPRTPDDDESFASRGDSSSYRNNNDRTRKFHLQQAHVPPPPRRSDSQQPQQGQDTLLFDRRYFGSLVRAVEMFEEGCTFDAVRNPMIPHYIPGEVRQMRLDRILIRPGCSAYLDGQTNIFGRDIIPGVPGNNITLSDHYGLWQDVVILDDHLLDRTKLSDQDIPPNVVENEQIVNVRFNRATREANDGDGDGGSVAVNPPILRRELRGNPIVKRIREHFASLPNDVTGVRIGLGTIIWKGVSFVAYPFFLLGRKLNII